MKNEEEKNMQKDLKSLQKNMKEQGYKLSFNGLSNGYNVRIMLAKEERIAQITIQDLGKEQCRVRTDDKVDRDVTLFLLENIESYFEKWGLSYIEVTSEWDLEACSYVKYNDAWFKTFGEKNQFVLFLTYMTNLLKEVQQDNESFSFELHETFREGAVNIDVRTFYQKNWLNVGLLENGKVLCSTSLLSDIEGREYDKDTFPGQVKTWIKNNESTGKIKHLFPENHTYPYLHAFLKTIDAFRYYSEIRNRITDCLLREMKYEEIEKLAKEKTERNETVLKYKKEEDIVTLIPFGEILIWIQIGKDEQGASEILELEVCKKEEKENVIRKFEGIVARWALGKQRTEILNGL